MKELKNKPLKPTEKSSTFKNYVLIPLITLIVGAFFIMPLPYYLEVPGTAENLKGVVEVNGKKDDYSGDFLMTTVGIRQSTPFSLIKGHFSDFTDVLTKKELYGTSTSKEYNKMQEFYMESSKNNAQTIALKAADIPYTLKFKGIYVLDIKEDSSFKGKIAIGDVVTKLNGESFESSQAFTKAIQGKKAGEEVTLSYLRDDKEHTATGKLMTLPETKKAGIGITLTDDSELKVPGYQISYDTGEIGGPSAGLMFTLETYNLLTKKDLRKGRMIAGTGTMNLDGTVGRIGGIDKKVVAASKSGAEIFLAPNDEIPAEIKKEHPELKTNYEEAKAAAEKIKTKMKVVPVTTFKDAVAYLEK